LQGLPSVQLTLFCGLLHPPLVIVSRLSQAFAMMHLELTRVTCLALAALMSCPWTPAAVREEGADVSLDHAAAQNLTGSSAPTKFFSCICKTDVQGTSFSAIIVTRPFGEALDKDCATKCPEMCPLFKENATYDACLVVRTEDGTTGHNLGKHLGLRPNIVDPEVTKEKQDTGFPPKPMRMVRHETALPSNLFAACTCFYQGEEVLAGHNDYYGGLQVWGRTGCGSKTCRQACNPLGAVGGDCVLSAMTDSKLSPVPKKGLLGYVTKPLTMSVSKHPFSVTKLQPAKQSS